MTTTPHVTPGPGAHPPGRPASSASGPTAPDWGAHSAAGPDWTPEPDGADRWYAEPAADDGWYDEDAYLATRRPATRDAQGGGVSPRGLVVGATAATAGCAALDLALTGELGFFLDLCFVVICLVAALGASPRGLFTVGVLPPLVFGGLIGVVTLVSPETIATGSTSRVFLTGLAAHAVPLCTAYGVALLVVCSRGLAHRSTRVRP